MLKTLLYTEISTKDLTYQPGGATAEFTLDVVNQSEQFATFAVEIQAPGVKGQSHWYVLSPEVSSKTPPGGRAKFTVQIIDNPKPGLIGLINLTVRVLALELRQEERHILRLRLEAGSGFVPLRVELPVRNFAAAPKEIVEIPVEVANPDHVAATVTVTCQSLPEAWFTAGRERHLRINAEDTGKITFLCRIPHFSQAPHQSYPFEVTAQRPAEPTAQQSGSLTLLPTGSADFHCTPLRQQIPQRRSWLPNWRAKHASYQAVLTNNSNVAQLVAIAVDPGPQLPQCQVEVIPAQAELHINQAALFDLHLTQRRKWWGRARRHRIQVQAQPSHPSLHITNDTQFLQLVLHPILPVWLQLLGGGMLLFLLWWASWLNPRNPFWGHHQPINSVQFNGTGERLISGSDDQMIQSWRTSGFTNPLINQNSGMLGNAQKAVRVVRYRPVNNDLVAAGLENGEIQLWRALPGDRQPIHTFANQPDDRVFSLAFSPDSRHLFSGHGSGTVVQWRLDADLARVPTQQREKNVGFAINALGLVGETDRHLAVAGRFNQLTLWDVEKDSLKAIPYDAGSQSDYILSLATASRKPYLLASGDNQGRIKLWNLQPCLTGPAPCQLLDTWTSGPQPSPAVYGLALSADGCYLASAAEDGQVKLWSLNPGGDRWPPRLDGQVLGRTRVASNSVDILRTRDQIRVVSGGDDTLVRFYQVQQSESNCQ